MAIEKVEEALLEESGEQAKAADDQPKKEESKSAISTPPDDPEFDLGVDEKGQPLKFKKSEILKFKQGSMLQDDYTKKTQDIAAQRKELEEMFKIVEHLKSNPKKAERVIAILEEKDEAIEEKKDEIDELLKTLPEDDPYAKILKAQRQQLVELQKNNKSLQDKLDGYEKKTATTEEQAAVEQAREVLTKVLDDIVKTLAFEDDDDKSEWRNAVLTYLVNNPQEYKTKEDFLNTLKSISDGEFKKLQARNERVTGRYLKKKGDPSKVPTHQGGGGGKQSKKAPSMDNLEETLVEELKNEEDKT